MHICQLCYDYLWGYPEKGSRLVPGWILTSWWIDGQYIAGACHGCEYRISQ